MDIKLQQKYNQEIVDEILGDGLDPDEDYELEHHFSGLDFEKLEKLAVELFKHGFEITDPEEVDLEDGTTLISFDALATHKLDIDFINSQTDIIIALSKKFNVDYDGWGVGFIEEE